MSKSTETSTEAIVNQQFAKRSEWWNSALVWLTFVAFGLVGAVYMLGNDKNVLIQHETRIIKLEDRGQILGDRVIGIENDIKWIRQTMENERAKQRP